MGRKFVGYVDYAWDDFSIFGRDAEKSTLDVVAKTIALSKKYDHLFYKTIKDSPFEAVVFATEEFSESEGEKWYEMWCDEDEHFVYDAIRTFFDEDTEEFHFHHVGEVLENQAEEYLMENNEIQLIFRYDRILVLSKNHEFITFSVRTDKLYRWFYKD